MTFDHPKRAGCCMACDTPVREIVSEFPEGHPLAGLPSRLGAFFDTMTEVEILLNTGATTHLTFCTACAPQLGPQHLSAIWRVLLDAEERAARARGGSENEFVSRMAGWMRLYPVAILYRRRIAGDERSRVIDRRTAA